MYIIKLDKNQGDMYKELYDYEGFRHTLNVEEATKFKTVEEAEKMLKELGLRNLYREAAVEKVK